MCLGRGKIYTAFYNGLVCSLDLNLVVRGIWGGLGSTLGVSESGWLCLADGQVKLLKNLS